MKFRHNLQVGEEVVLKANPAGGVTLTMFYRTEWMESQDAESFAMLVTGPPSPEPPRPKEKVVYVDFVTKERMR